MSHFPRANEPGCLEHVLSRFAGGEYRFTDDALRAGYLRRLEAALIGSDWRTLTYALMSTHTHLAMVAGEAPASAWMRPLHTGVAGALNRAQGRFGPVFAGRAKTIGVDAEDAFRLVRYIHNNPVRAGLVRDPFDSPWTPHRAFVGEAPAPPWLDVERALSLCGFDSSPSGRLAFHDAVRARAGDGRDPALSGDRMLATRAQVRRLVGAPAELTMPRAPGGGPGTARHGVLLPAHAPLHPRWPGDPRLLLTGVAALTGVSVAQMQSRDRSRRFVEARRLFVLAGRRLGRTVVELGALVAVSGQAATHLLRSSPHKAAALESQVTELVRVCWGAAESGGLVIVERAA